MQDERQKPIAQNVLAFVLDQILRLLHPFVPFITEGIFQKLNEIITIRKLKNLVEAKEENALVVAEWPEGIDALRDLDAEKQIEIVQSAVRSIRDMRSERNIPPKKRIMVSAKTTEEKAEIFNDNTELSCLLAGLEEFTAGVDIIKPVAAVSAVVDDTEFYFQIERDVETERTRFKKQKQEIEKAKKAVEAKLTNKNFITKAKPEVVAQARDRLAELTEQLKTVEKHLAELK